MTTLRDSLKNWVDIDGAQYELGKCLGIIDEDFQDAKHMLWSNHFIGNILFEILDFLEEKGLIKMRDHDDFGLQYKWID